MYLWVLEHVPRGLGFEPRFFSKGLSPWEALVTEGRAERWLASSWKKSRIWIRWTQSSFPNSEIPGQRRSFCSWNDKFRANNRKHYITGVLGGCNPFRLKAILTNPFAHPFRLSTMPKQRGKSFWGYYYGLHSNFSYFLRFVYLEIIYTQTLLM